MKFWLKGSAEPSGSIDPPATFTVEQHKDGLWLMADDGRGTLRPLAKFRPKPPNGFGKC